MSDAAHIDADDVDPDIRRFVDALNHGYGQFSDFASLPLPERRAAAEAVRGPWREGGPAMHRTINLSVDVVGLRLYVPSDAAALPAMLYVHGGGWTMFSVETHDRLMREYAARAGVIVAGIDYSLSPEAKFPHALNEVVAAIAWLRAEGEAYGIDTARIAIGGDSAGANLSVAASLKLRDQGLPPLAAMLLNYGAFDSRPTESYARYDGPNYMLTVEEMDRFWDNYVDDPGHLADPFAAPLRAELHDLPPAFLAIAECDILADGNRLIAARFEAAGVPVEAHVYPGATHSFLEAVSISPLADRAIEDGAQWLRARIGR
ncbi:MAG: alpha/beta hydrolase fold domain-containing protein [Sphingomonas sp.]|jgi:acetyl esterase|uniref:alpha/beta hydrolase fold domain-containing protein n=1 Tax=Sphingomonas sp. TaxID=28214 RepID=UPI003567738F